MTNNIEFRFRGLPRKGRTAALSILLALVFGTVAVTAQTLNHHLDQVAAADSRLDQNAIFNGYGAGYAHGDRDSISGVNFKPRRDDVFTQGTSGYSSEMGSVQQYQSGFRQAYERGYTDGYNGRDRDLAMMVPPIPSAPGIALERYDGAPNASSRGAYAAAATNGYNAGYKRGAEARGQRASYAYQEDAIYQQATEGYGVDMGGRGEYQSNFRQVYSRGYSDGFNGRAHVSDAGQVYGGDDQPTPTSESTDPIDVTQLAIANGYHHGFERGSSITRAGQTFAYRSQEIYRVGLSGYEPGWDKQSYFKSFRKGYEIGHRDGYRRLARNIVYEGIYAQHVRSTQ
jgi:hypothetical protein